MALYVEIALPEHLRPYVVSKGSIAVNGAIFTVVESLDDRFSVALIPYTQEHTNWSLATGNVSEPRDTYSRKIRREFLQQNMGEAMESTDSEAEFLPGGRASHQTLNYEASRCELNGAIRVSEIVV